MYIKHSFKCKNLTPYTNNWRFGVRFLRFGCQFFYFARQAATFPKTGDC